MNQFNPFSSVSCKYGAPMGRRSDNPANLEGARRLHARHQGGSDGYDKGGAYWGFPCDVWCVWGWVNGEAIVVYVRAPSRQSAIAKATNK
jgi:hypothetical protein